MQERKSTVQPKYKINLAPDIFELGDDSDNNITLTVTRNSAQPITLRQQEKDINSPWEKDK